MITYRWEKGEIEECVVCLCERLFVYANAPLYVRVWLEIVCVWVFVCMCV